MQIQEVSNRTGLTKRTIRFYIEKELIDPEIVVRNGKEYREYTEEDVKNLLSIAELRKALFSIEQIKEMMDQPAQIPSILEEYHAELRENYQNLSRLLKILEHLEPGQIRDVYQLSGAVSDVSREMRLPRPDITPHFGRLDLEFGPEENGIPPRTPYFTRWFAGFLAAVILVTGLICFLSWNNRIWNPRFAGKQYHLLSKEEHAVTYYNTEGRTVRISGIQETAMTMTRLMTLAYNTYYIKAVEPDGEVVSYAYMPTDSPWVWIVGKYDVSGFTNPGKFVIGDQQIIIEDYEDVPKEVRFILDGVTAYRNYKPIYRAMIPVYLAVPAAFIFWFIVLTWWNGKKVSV